MFDHLFRPPSDEERIYALAAQAEGARRARRSRILQVLNAVYWVTVIGAVGWFGWQIADRQPPVTIQSATPDNRVLRAGDDMKVRYVLDRRKRCDLALTWSIVDSRDEVHRFGPKFVRAPRGPGHDEYVVGYATTGSLPSGEATLYVSAAYECPGNYLQRWWPIELDFPGVVFDVTGRQVPEVHDTAPSVGH